MWAWGKHILSGLELLTPWGLAPVEKNEAQSKDPSGRIVTKKASMNKQLL